MEDLKIRVISQLPRTQQDIETNLKNFYVEAWEHPYIAPKAQFDVVLPMSISVGAAKIISNIVNKVAIII